MYFMPNYTCASTEKLGNLERFSRHTSQHNEKRYRTDDIIVKITICNFTGTVFPDPDYMDRLEQELAAIGIHDRPALGQLGCWCDE